MSARHTLLALLFLQLLVPTATAEEGRAKTCRLAVEVASTETS